MSSNAEPLGQGRFLREALLQEPVGDRIRCNICHRRCLLSSGGLGWCRTRAHRAGRILMLTYGAVSSLAPNPIEKKPFYHFHPGTYALTVGSWSCNFGCPWCQNWEISKVVPSAPAEFLAPDDFVGLAERSGCEGTSMSFNEPTLSLEWSLESFRRARKHGLYNTYVTNGYMTPEALALLAEAGLDAMNVDIKGDAQAVRRYCKGIDVEHVWSTCKAARRCGVHIEITTLVIPQVNDSEEILRGIASRIARELGVDVPWHVTAYQPCYRHAAPPTPVATLERAWSWAKEEGLHHVYVGNVPGHAYDNTYCPGCGRVLIRRYGFENIHSLMREGKCAYCGLALAGIWTRQAAGDNPADNPPRRPAPHAWRGD